VKTNQTMMLFGTNESLKATALLLITSTLLHSVHMVEGMNGLDFSAFVPDNSMVPLGLAGGFQVDNIELGCAGGFAVISKTGVSTTGTTEIVGDMGISPIAATAYTGFGLVADFDAEYPHASSSLVTGDMYAADFVAPTNVLMTKVILDMEAALTDANSRTPNYVEVSNSPTANGIIDGMTLGPGVYWWSFIKFKTITLDAGGDPDAVFIMQVQYIITMWPDAEIILTGGAQAKNIFWACTAVTIDVRAKASGIFLASTLITMNTDSSLNGAALAQSAVTLQFTTINNEGSRGLCDVAGVTAAPVVLATDAPTFAPVVVQEAAADTCSDNVVLVKTTGTTPYPLPVPAVETQVEVTVPPVEEASAADSVNFLNIGEAGKLVILARDAITLGAGPPAFGVGAATPGEETPYSINGDVGIENKIAGATGFAKTIDVGQTFYESPYTNGKIYGPLNNNVEIDLDKAVLDVKNAYNYALALDTDSSLAPAIDLIGKTYQAGVYKWTGALGLSAGGTVTFDGSATDVFVMISEAAFTTGSMSKVEFTGGAKAENLFWVLGGALTAGANSDMYGTVLCAVAMTIGANARWTGALLTWGITGPAVGAVTIGANAEINGASCGPICLGEDGDDNSGTGGSTEIVTTTTEATPPVVDIVSQDTSTVTVRLNQEWSTSSDSETLAIFYEYKEDIWTNKCHVADGVRGSSKVDEFTVTCNVLSPYAHLHICVADNKADENGKDILSPTGDDATIPRCCNAEDIVPENTATVCYSLEILCEPKCIDTTSESRKLRRLRGSE